MPSAVVCASYSQSHHEPCAVLLLLIASSFSAKGPVLPLPARPRVPSADSPPVDPYRADLRIVVVCFYSFAMKICFCKKECRVTVPLSFLRAII
mmetsp:Transcript_31601/g.53334  ORF Transcript_31601/g.53334 Transcript_31601/m.53334 type:complete len:94 (+) Transcript_31601:1259-1540(+)